MVNRHGTGIAVVFGLFALAAPGVGESDRSHSRAIGVIRAIVSAESVYAEVRGGRFATVDCLADPACGATDVAFAPLLSPDLAVLQEHDGYRFEFYPTPDPRWDRRARAALTRFAVAAVPASHATKSKRAFCGDDRGVVYVTVAGRIPLVEQGRCADTRSPLRASQ